MLKLKLKWQLLIPILGIVVIGIGALQLFSYWKSSLIVENLISNSITRDSEAASRSLDDRINMVEKSVSNWAKNEKLVEVAEGNLKMVTEVNSFLATALKDFSWFETLALAGPDGNVFASSSPQAIGKNISSRSYFKTSMNGNLGRSKPVASKQTGNPVFVSSVPIRDASGSVCAVLFAAVNLQTIYNEVLAPVKIGANGYAFVLDSNGLIIGHPNKDFVLKLNINKTDFGQVVLSKKTGYHKYFFPEQNQWKAMSFKEVPQTGWIVATTAPLGELMASLDTIRDTSILGTILIVFLAGLVIFVIVGWITKTFGSFVEIFRKIAQGDLRVSLSKKDLNKNDEIGDMARALEEMTSNLTKSISSIGGTTDEMTTGSAELSSSAQTLSQGASEQAASIEEISSNIEEITSSIRQNAENATQTQKIAVQAAADAEQGGKAVLETVNAMKDIADKISIIEDIARQTNLLALNAAIEAARAGEHGKGFAVVAAEVRKLAEHSGKAASEISELSVSSVEVSEKAGEMLGTIIPDIQRTAELVYEISTTCGEQDSGVTQINHAIQQFDSIVQNNASASEEMASTSEQLSAQSDLLRNTVEFFTLNGNGKSSTSSQIIVSSNPKPALQSAATSASQINLQSVKKGFSPSIGSIANDEYERF
jgi:methyl-accepting chemotaxis protein